MLLSELQAGKTPPKEGDYVIDFDAIDNDAINDMYMLNQTAEWSFGPITAADCSRLDAERGIQGAGRGDGQAIQAKPFTEDRRLRQAYCEAVYVALSMGRVLPPEAVEAYHIDESGCVCRPWPRRTRMTQRGIERLIDYRAVKTIIEYGGSMRF